MVTTENILFLGSFCLITVQAQLHDHLDCEKFPLNPLCTLTQVNRLPLLDQPQISPNKLKPPDLRSEKSNAREQRHSPYPPNFPRPHDFRSSNGARSGGNLLTPAQNSHNNFMRANDMKASNSEANQRKKRFFFWYTPADLLQMKMNHWRNKLTRLQMVRDNANPWNRPVAPNVIPYDYDCLKAINQQQMYGLPQSNHHNPVKNSDSYMNYNMNAPPLILASPVLLHEHAALENNYRRAKKNKSKQMKYAVEMDEDNEETSEEEPTMRYMRDHAPKMTDDSNSDEAGSENKQKMSKKKINSDFDLSSNGERIEFQVQGHNGPKTYIFGFDTGDGKNRQYRLEERLKDGTVKGQYGYYDARGKLRTIKYLARPMEGYKEKHHEMNLSDLA